MLRAPSFKVSHLQDHLCWESAHVVGYSLGGMVAIKLAALQPGRVLSLAIISSSLGGWHTIPLSLKAYRYVLSAMRDPRPATRAHVDLKFHFSRQTRKAWVRKTGWEGSQGCTLHAAVTPTRCARASHPTPPLTSLLIPQLGDRKQSRHEVLHEEYVTTQAVQTPQPLHAAAGQRSAYWSHSLSRAEADRIVAARIPTLCLHGRHDLVVRVSTAQKLAAMLHAPLVIMGAAHFLPRECGHEVNLFLESLILGQARQAERAHLDPSRHLASQVDVLRG